MNWVAAGSFKRRFEGSELLNHGVGIPSSSVI
jgi:hypothetical protein